MSNELFWDLYPPPAYTREEEDRWSYSAYRLTRKTRSLVPLDRLKPLRASFDVACGVDRILRALDLLEDAPNELRAASTWPGFHDTRLFGAAMSFAHGLVRQVYAPEFKGQELWTAAHKLRDKLRAELDKLASDGDIDDSLLPRRRGNSSASIGRELVELAQVGQHTLLLVRDHDPDVFRRLIEARFEGEQLLTTIGKLDAPPVVRETNNSYRQLASLLVLHWEPLRERIAARCDTPEKLERLAPEFVWA